MDKERATEPDKDIVGDVEERIEGAEDAEDDARLEVLEEVHRSLESELSEGAETPPSGR
jgi:hypothetical protein